MSTETVTTATRTTVPPYNPRSRQRDSLFWAELEYRQLLNMIDKIWYTKSWVGVTPLAAETRQELKNLVKKLRIVSEFIEKRIRMYLDMRKSVPSLPYPGLSHDYSNGANGLGAEGSRGRGGNGVVNKLSAAMGAATTSFHVVPPEQIAAGYLTKTEIYEQMIEDLDAKSSRECAEMQKNEKGKSKVGFFGSGSGSGFDGNNQSVSVENDPVAANTASMAATSIARQQLLESHHLRRRNTSSTNYADDIRMKSRSMIVDAEEAEKHYARRQEQEKLTEDLLEMVGKLKDNFSGIHAQLQRDNKVLDETDQLLDANLNKVTRGQKNLDTFSQRSTWRTYYVYFAVLFAILVWVFMLFFIYVTKFL